MKPINYSKIDEIKTLLSSNGWVAQKKFGQNYLINEDCRRLIWKTLNAQKGELIWEIGPGLGALTHMLANRGEDFLVFELDEGYCDFLVRSFQSCGLHMVRGDFLKTWKSNYALYKPDKIVGNLPYNVSSQIILSLIEGTSDLPFCVFTLQKELAERLCARVGQKQYSAFSLLCQWGFEIKLVKIFPASVFYPRPQVTSALLTLKPSNRYSLATFPAFRRLVKTAFSSRRKTLKNNLSDLFRRKGLSLSQAQEIFHEKGISLSQRAEELSLQDYVDLAPFLDEN